ncbi:hypothetical protein FS837_011764 [Tulasnella sp. UAMH 9824]|nr:hypothetical protein FS837_011764 [Tulasnella sp. UAMH 9824]
MPKATLAHGGIMPEDGTAAKRPAMVPEQKPTMVYLQLYLKSNKYQSMSEKPAAILVVHPATTARRLAQKAQQASKPRSGKAYRQDISEKRGVSLGSSVAREIEAKIEPPPFMMYRSIRAKSEDDEGEVVRTEVDELPLSTSGENPRVGETPTPEPTSTGPPLAESRTPNFEMC